MTFLSNLFFHSRRSPFHRTAPPGLCWVCNRHIGPALTCPYCEAIQPFRSARIALRLIALTLSLAGIAALLASAHLHPPPHPTPIARLNFHSPYAVARIEGHLVCKPRSAGRYPITRLQDESGTIRILLDHAIGPDPTAQPRALRPGQALAILGSAALDSKGRTVFYGLKWSSPESLNPL